MNRLDIIIVNYNSSEYLLNCLHSIYISLNRNVLVNVYIVDNASKDQVHLLKYNFPQIRLLKNKTNVGFAKAVNYFISKTDAPYILLLNPDTLLDKKLIHTMLVFMESNPDIGISGPKILENNGKVQGSARSFPTPMTAFFGRNAILTKFFPDNRLSKKNVLSSSLTKNIPVQVDWVSGACMMVRRKAIEDVGLMDEAFFMYWEDADWCRRMTRHNWKVVYFPLTSIVHYSGKSSEHNFFQTSVAFHKSAYYLFNKYYKDKPDILKILVCMGLGARLCFLLIFHWIFNLYKQK